MHYDVSYKGDNSGRRAINDLIRYVGLKRSKILLKFAKDCAKVEDDVARNKAYNGLCFNIEVFCGVAGEPIRRLVAYVGGEEQLESWLNSDDAGEQKVKKEAAHV